MKKNICIVLVLCMLMSMLGIASAEAAYTAGTYTAAAAGFGGEVKVTVTVDDKTITDDTTWKIELAGFEAMYKLGLEKREFLEPYFDDERGYVRRAAERVRLRVYGK